MAKRGNVEWVSASMPEYTRRAFEAGREQDERARWSVVVPLALEKRLFLNVRPKYLLVPLLGKKCCDINNRRTSLTIGQPTPGPE